MKVIIDSCTCADLDQGKNCELTINSAYLKDSKLKIHLPELTAYPPFINSHDHLVGNWFPRAGDNHPYATTDIWVEEMKQSASFQERNRIWINDGSFKLTEGNAPLLTQLGMYKNIFSGCIVVQDHGPNQIDSYYDSFSINVIRNYRQCHSLSLGNWWGGRSAEKEWQDTKGKMPFILHLAEGTDGAAKSSFQKLEELGLLQPNTLIIHGIALTPEDIKKCAEAGTSICCCPESNNFLIGETIDIKACLDSGVNLVLGTDSTMSGTPNLLHEIRIFHKYFPDIPMQEVFKLITSNAQKAMMIDADLGYLNNTCSNLLLTRKKHDDPYENLLHITEEDIEFLMYNGKPIYGSYEFLKYFELDPADYFIFSSSGKEKFAIGHPEKIDSILGYHKELPYLPF